MKTLMALLLAAGVCCGQDVINFKDRTATFTNLQGQAFADVTLIRADLDGIMWRSGASGGRVCYTNLHPDVIESFGVSSNRIETARARAAGRGAADARFRAERAAEAAKQEKERAAWAAAAPEREKNAQKEADQKQIDTMVKRISAAKEEIRRAEVISHDHNMATAGSDGSYLYVKESSRYEVEQMEKQLREMRAAFIRKYGRD